MIKIIVIFLNNKSFLNRLLFEFYFIHNSLIIIFIINDFYCKNNHSIQIKFEIHLYNLYLFAKYNI